jgi:Na+/melibiose symporter-like transporter
MKQRGQFAYTVMGYGLIGAFVLLIGVIIAALTYWAVRLRLSPDSFRRWSGLIVFTLGMFGWLIKQLRRLWSHWAFWVTLIGLLFVHLAFFIVLLLKLAEWRSFWFLIITGVEAPIFSSILPWAARRLGKMQPL